MPYVPRCACRVTCVSVVARVSVQAVLSVCPGGAQGQLRLLAGAAG